MRQAFTKPTFFFLISLHSLLGQVSMMFSSIETCLPLGSSKDYHTYFGAKLDSNVQVLFQLSHRHSFHLKENAASQFHFALKTAKIHPYLSYLNSGKNISVNHEFNTGLTFLLHPLIKVNLGLHQQHYKWKESYISWTHQYSSVLGIQYQQKYLSIGFSTVGTERVFNHRQNHLLLFEINYLRTKQNYSISVFKSKAGVEISLSFQTQFTSKITLKSHLELIKLQWGQKITFQTSTQINLIWRYYYQKALGFNTGIGCSINI